MKYKYTHKCPNCGVIDLYLKMSDVPVEECPHCKSKEIKRIFASDFTWRFKEGGDFGKSTDYN